MTPRSITIGNYNTYADGLWTLSAWEFSPAEFEWNFVEVPGRSEPLDLTGSLTDGEPTYKARSLTITLESSEGTRPARKARIDEMINQLDGRQFDIVLPDDPDSYIVGRVSVKELYNDMAHASVQVTATCHPWRYANEETTVHLEVAAKQTVTLINQGRRSVVPVVTVEGQDVIIAYGSWSKVLSAGTYQLPDLHLTPGEHVITQSVTDLTIEGTTLTFTYREARL